LGVPRSGPRPPPDEDEDDPGPRFVPRRR
jgi:hypothetical protein